MAARGFPVLLPAVSSSGTAVATYKVYGWVPSSAGAATATPRSFYSDAELTTPASNPATLGASTRLVYINPSLAITLVVKSSDDATTYLTAYYPADPAVGDLGSVVPMVCANNAAMTALTSTTGLADNGIYETLGKSTERDGGEGRWVYDSASTTTVNGGTILAIDGGGAGRFFRLFDGEVNVQWFGAKGDSSTDNTAAFQAAINASEQVYVPNGNYDCGLVTIVTPVTIRGENTISTIIRRISSPSNDYDGIFKFVDGGTFGSIMSLTLVSKAGQSGGCLMSIKPTSSGALGIFYFEAVDFTTLDPSGTTGTHAYTIWMDGTAKTSAPIGIRGVDFYGCNVFGAATSVMLIKGVLKLSFVGGGVYPAGGNSASNVSITGTAGVPSSSFKFMPADCSCDVSLDYAANGSLACGVFGAITNTANTSYVHGWGNANSVQSNWTNSIFTKGRNTIGDQTWDTDAFAIDTANNRIGVGTATPTIAGDFANGNVSGYWKTSSTTKIGHVGYQHTTIVPDTQTITFTTAAGGEFRVSTGGGAGVLCFADYKSATISLVSNPSSEFENSSTPTAGKTGIYKSANSHVISVKNGVGTSITYAILVTGIVNATTDPA